MMNRDLNLNKNEKEVFEFILDSIPDAITVIDTNYKTIFFNKVSESYFDVKKEDIIGKDLRTFFPNSLLPKVIDLEKSYFNIYNRPRENTFTVISAIPLYNTEGKLIGGLARDRDITEFVKLSEVLSKTQTNLEELEKEYKSVMQGENFFSGIISNNSEFIKTINLCRNISKTPMPVWLNGESGTGKELFVRAIHHESKRPGKLVAINCAAIPEELFESELFGYEEGAFTGAKKGGKIGKFEEANNGTLFFDEIGDMPLRSQPKILRALEEGHITRIGSNRDIPIDVRILSATHKNIEDAVRNGEFRKDLYYRLNGFHVHIMPLRDRKQDILILANRFLQQFCMENSINIIEIPDDVLKIFLNHHWDGNVRELRNIMQRVVLLAKENKSDRVMLEYLPDYLQNLEDLPNMERFHGISDQGLEQSIEAIEKEMIMNALEKNSHNKKKTAEYLKIPRSSLYYKMEKHGI
ncbi:MAG: sigma 54-interacting transcriptional regulator [Eubacteriales bacterium]|nr:sigma 54-interacting transcriptional regulator [Eubacteriales bacterium]